MILKNIIESTDIKQCVDELVAFHRRYYYEPGYILSSNKISALYNQVFEKVMDYRHTTTKHTLLVSADKDKFKLTVGDILFRDWFIENNQPYSKLYYMNVDFPKQLSNMSILLEIIYEITYYSFPKTVENPI